MSIGVKICGLNDAPSVEAVSEGGARYAGFVFYPLSPRAVDAETATYLIALLSPSIMPVGLFVNPTDAELDAVLAVTPLRALQLHGDETPERVEHIRMHTGLEIIKAVGIASAEDIDTARRYEACVDMLLLDAKPSKDDLLPGGNARSINWSLLSGVKFSRPWMLAGGLRAENCAEAVATTGARLLDVSSGVEDAPGRKNPDKIRTFLHKAAQIETSC